ncbi:MFS transporter [Rhizobium metallidurans]|uniref:MFS family permease n=1 Tax=Rhizobium metallidurans TaxID=1265931 RepID=A0A7W6CV61_9HYPH|nr:MFS transporter [Rhizobium metallidurans]MBB3965497.1 MFS family permease [Rhizobium metallidurans]
MTSTEASPADTASVFQLFARPVLPATLMLGGGVTLYAVETYIMATIAPSIVRDIGGLPLLFWVTTLYVAAAVLGSIFVAMRPRGTGLRTVYVAGAVMFAAGSLICGLAPSMPVVLVGRAVQGFGAGALAALSYAFIRFVYPEPLWRKASTLYAAIWGVSTLLGPSLGGLFSDGSDWRHAFMLIVPVGVIMALLGPLLLPAATDDRAAGKTPVPQIALLIAAVILVSLAGTVEATRTKALLIGASIIAAGLMLAIEKRSENRLLPTGAVTLGNPLARVYLIIFTLMLVLTSDIYIPYFLQTLHGITPLESGYLTALVALGWTLAAFFSGTLSGRRARRAIVAGCVLETIAAASLAVFLARDNQGGSLAILSPAVAGMFLMGFGVGMAWAHLITKILRIVEKAEQDKASAAITTVQSLGSAFGAALAGVIVNSTGLVTPGGIEGGVSAAHWLFALMALPGILTVVASLSIRASGDQAEARQAAA